LEALERRDQPSFVAAPSYPVGATAQAVAAGRFNAGPHTDLAVIGGGKLTILAGSADGTFTQIASYSQSGRYVIAAELTGDNVRDLAIATGSAVLVRAGNGDGTFAPPISYSGGKPRSVVAGDFDGDGDLDLAAPDGPYGYYGTGKVRVLINAGDGSFVSGGTNNAETDGRDIVTADFDNDGDLDLAVSGWCFCDYGDTQQRVKVLLGNGDGTFTSGVTLPAAYPDTLATGDFNADGKLDLAVSSFYQGVGVYLGIGNGGFTFFKTIPISGYIKSVGTSDFNGDGLQDLAVVAESAANVSVLHGIGNGDFEFARRYGLDGAFAYDVVAADLDNDADFDLAGTAGEAVSILRNDSSGFFQPAVATIATVTGGVLNVEAADFNVDGTPDLAVTGGLNQLTVIPVNADGTYGTAVSYTVGLKPQGLVAADFNHDGFPDLATADTNTEAMTLLLNKGNGTFFPARTFAAGLFPVSIGAADFTGDGKLDIVTLTTSLNLLRGTGAGRFRAPISFSSCTNPNVLTVADFDGDTDSDVAVTCGTQPNTTVKIFLSNGNGSFAPPLDYAVGSNVTDMESADLNGDGNMDLAVHANGIYALLGNGDGTFAIISNPDPGALGMEVADFNRDGMVDLALTQRDAPLNVILGNGDGTFQSSVYYATGNTGFGAVAADFNGDNWPDLAMTQIWSSGIAVAINDADWSPAPAPSNNGARPKRLDSASILATALQNGTERDQPTMASAQVIAPTEEKTAVVADSAEPTAPRPESRLRLVVRIGNGQIDIGAFELQVTAHEEHISSNVDN
jgi:hypothetical protein